MMKNLARWLRHPSTVLALAMAAAPLAAHASQVYTYTGQFYTDVTGAYTNSMRVSGSFTLAQALAADLPATDITGLVTQFSFFDGLHTIDTGSTKTMVFSIGTDAAGGIDEFNIFLETGYPFPTSAADHRFRVQLSSSNVPTHAEAIDWQCMSVDFNNQCNGEFESQSGRDNNPNWLRVWISSAQADLPTPSTGLLVALALALLAGARRGAPPST